MKQRPMFDTHWRDGWPTLGGPVTDADRGTMADFYRLLRERQAIIRHNRYRAYKKLPVPPMPFISERKD